MYIVLLPSALSTTASVALSPSRALTMSKR
jgi:hypothetical protein